jgi:orotidine-5'-phosphate decarboxylase
MINCIKEGNMFDLLDRAVSENNSLLCVGLDPDPKRIPAEFLKEDFPLFSFNREIIDATAAEVCAFKPQVAYYSASGRERDLELTIEYIRNRYPHIPVILDAKRGDIGSTADMYAREAFVRYRVDAVTVNPYMGFDTIEPYLEWPGKGVIILCKTSNPGSGFLQDLQVNGEPIFELVARQAAIMWQQHQNVMLVVGATYPGQLKRVREIAGEMTFLVPGVGHQGADIGQVVKNGLNSNKRGLIISSSRGIIYAGTGGDFQKAAAAEAGRIKEEINRYRCGSQGHEVRT